MGFDRILVYLQWLLRITRRRHREVSTTRLDLLVSMVSWGKETRGMVMSKTKILRVVKSAS
jgi:hypothetical protein